MKIKNLILLAAVLVVAISCDSNTKKTKNGTEFTYLKKGTGVLATDSLISLFNMSYAIDTGQEIFKSEAGNPQPMKVDTSLPGGDNEVIKVLSMLKVGDSVVFNIPVNDFFEKLLQGVPRPDSIKEESKIVFNVGYVDQVTEAEYRDSMMKKQREAEAAQLKIDDEVIEKYLTDNNINAQRTESGLRYIITKEGSGENAKKGDMVTVSYVGRLLNGQLFDTNIESVAKETGTYQEGRNYKEPFSFKLGFGQVIRGWDEGISLLKKGGKAKLFIPSSLAYGPSQRGPVIKANSILTFDVELTDIAKPEATK